VLRRVFVARPCPLPSTIHALPLFSAHAVDRIGAGVRRSSQEFGRGNLTGSGVRRSLKGFGRGSLIGSGSYGTDGRSLAGRGWTFFRRGRPTMFAHTPDPRLRAGCIGRSPARVEKDGYSVIGPGVHRSLQKPKREDLIGSGVHRSLGGFAGRAAGIDPPPLVSWFSICGVPPAHFEGGRGNLIGSGVHRSSQEFAGVCRWWWWW
jgi:hypothetical protein